MREQESKQQRENSRGATRSVRAAEKAAAESQQQTPEVMSSGAAD